MLLSYMESSITRMGEARPPLPAGPQTGAARNAAVPARDAEAPDLAQ